MAFPGGASGKESTYNAGDLGLIPRSGRSPGEGHTRLSCTDHVTDHAQIT